MNGFCVQPDARLASGGSETKEGKLKVELCSEFDIFPLLAATFESAVVPVARALGRP